MKIQFLLSVFPKENIINNGSRVGRIFLRFLTLVSCALVIAAYEHFLPPKSSFVYLSMVDQSSLIHGLATNE